MNNLSLPSGILLFSVVLIIACTSSEGENVVIEERDGVVYVENRVEGLWGEEVPVRFELEQVFGVESEPEEAIYNELFDFFDDKGRFLGSMWLDDEAAAEIGRPQHVGPDGREYTCLDDPYPQVRRYRVEIVES